MKSVDELSLMVLDYIESPDKFVYPFVIKEKNGKERTIITYNKYGSYGGQLRKTHEQITEAFKKNFYQRNLNSYAYHKNVRCFDALQNHLKSNYFIKIDIHHFFESITLVRFFKEYGEFFNDYWKTAITGLFYKESLSIGFVSSPVISDFFMKKFDNAVERYLDKYPKLHYSRYSDDMLLSSEEDSDESLEELFTFIVDELNKYGLEINDKKTRRMKLDYQKHNSISYLGLNISKQDEINNKITISKRYILFILYLINKQKGYKDHCYPLENEIKSRVAYLAYNSPISYRRFQTKHMRIYGEPFMFVPKELDKRMMSQVMDEIPNFEEYAQNFKINIHKKVDGKDKSGFGIKDAIELEKYLGKDQETVEIPYFIDSIGEDCFNGHNEIKKVVLNDKLKVINKNAFAFCGNLKEINLPEALRFVGDSAFKYCSNLKEITIPSKVKKIGPNAFYGAGLTRVNLSEGVEVIDHHAFYNTNLTHIDFPVSLKEIGQNAFDSCSNLLSTNIKDSMVERIGGLAFSSCVRLKEFTAPTSLTTIDGGAFQYCRLLSKVKISSSVLEIHRSAFSGCSSLTSIEVDKDNKVYLHRDDNQSLIERWTNKLIITLKPTIDDDVEIIGEGVFTSSLVESIVVPEGVTSIGDNAFSYMHLLKEVSLPSTLKEIGNNAFAGCISLKEITIPEGVEAIPNSAFRGCTNLEVVHMSDNVKSIGNNAFEEDKLLKIYLPKEITRIGERAFKNCVNNKELYIPAKVKSIKKNAFLGLSKVLESIKVDPLNTTYSSGEDSNVIAITKTATILLGCKNSKIDKGMRNINKYAFSYCEGLTNISFPDTLKTIGANAFRNCINLSKVDLNLVTHIEDQAFFKTSSLKEIELPNSIIKIGTYAFAGSGLTSIKIPESVVEIAYGAFANNHSLENIYLPVNNNFTILIFVGCDHIKHIEVNKDNLVIESMSVRSGILSKGDNALLLGDSNTIIGDNVTRIANGAFIGNKYLESIVVPELVKTIGSEAFKDCTSLKRVEIKGNIKSLPYAIFKGCTSLEEVILPDTIETIELQAFDRCYNLKSITLPYNLVEIREQAFRYAGLESILLPRFLTRINSSAFKGTKIKSVFLPDSVQYLGSHSFMDCKELKEVTLPDGIKDIGDMVFANDVKLEKIIIPDSVEKLGSKCFFGCINLKEVKLSNNIENISNSTFEGCESLTKINLPSKLKWIMDSAFMGCINLTIKSFPSELSIISSLAFAGDKKLGSITIPSSVTKLSPTAFLDTDLEHIKVQSGNKIFYDDKKDTIFFNNNVGERCILFGCKNSIIPDNVVGISESAFALVNGLKLKKLPDSLRKISNYAFYKCNCLDEIVCPERLKTIGSFAFTNCDNVKKIKLSDNLTSVGNGAFSGISIDKLHVPASVESISLNGLTFKEISVDKNNKVYSDFNSNVFAFINGKVLFTGDNASLSEGMTEINPGCYNNQHFDKLVLPESLIALDGFSNCGNIKEVHINKNLKQFRLGADTHIEKVYVDKDNPYMYTNNEHTMLIDRSAFRTLRYAENGNIVNGVTEVTYQALSRREVKSLFIPKTVTSVDFITYIYKNSLEEIVVDKDNPYFESVNNAIIEKSTNALVFVPNNSPIPEKVERIKKYSLASKRKEVHIPKNVSYIEKEAFILLKEVESYSVDKDNPIFDSRDNCNAIIASESNLVIAVCKNTKLPDGVIYIDKSNNVKEEQPYVGVGSGSFDVIRAFDVNEDGSLKDDKAFVSMSEVDFPF